MNPREPESLPAPRSPLTIDPPPPPKRSVEHWFVLAAAVGGLALLVVLGAWVRPDARGFGTHEQLGLPKCHLLGWTGIPCPGCGVTTAVAFAARGDLWSSLRAQPFGIVTIAALVAFGVWAIRGHVAGRDLYCALQTLRIRGFVWIAVVGALAVAWIYKIVVIVGERA